MSDMIHVFCPACFAPNRLPEARIDAGPRCGACKNALIGGVVPNLNAKYFAKITQGSSLPVMVDCWAPWCGPCKAMAPAFEQAAQALQGQVYFAKLNTEEEQILGQSLGIRSIPTLLLFARGKEVARQAGAMSAEQITSWLKVQLQNG